MVFGRILFVDPIWLRRGSGEYFFRWSEKVAAAKIQESVSRINRALDSVGEKIQRLQRNAAALQRFDRRVATLRKDLDPPIPLVAGGFSTCGNT